MTDDDPLEPNDDAEDPEESSGPTVDDVVSGAKTRGENIGEAAGRGLTVIGRAISSFLFQLLYAFVRVLPKTSTLWKNMMLKSAKAYQKQTGADAIGFNARPNGTIDPIPVKWNPDGETPKWVSKDGDNEWGPGSEGRSTDRFGKANAILLDEDGLEKFETLDARVAEAIELDNWDSLYTDPVIQKTVIDSSGVNSQQPVADGGYPQDAMQSYKVRDIGELEDALIDISSGDGLGGMRVSWRKFKELRTETTTTEEMQRQEDRGRIAELEGKEDLAKKMLMIAGAIVVLSLGVAFVAPKLLSSGGGGGGGMVSFYTGGVTLQTLAGGML